MSGECDAEGWAERARVLADAGKYEEALLAADRAIELDQSFVLAEIRRGSALGHLGRHEEALRACDHVAFWVFVDQFKRELEA